MVYGLDTASEMKNSIANKHGRELPLKICPDSKCLYDILVAIGSKRERRRLIDLAVLRQSCVRRENSELCWIPTSENPADGLIKDKHNGAL